MPRCVIRDNITRANDSTSQTPLSERSLTESFASKAQDLRSWLKASRRTGRNRLISEERRRPIPARLRQKQIVDHRISDD
jgi:hypothetical protein